METRHSFHRFVRMLENYTDEYGDFAVFVSTRKWKDDNSRFAKREKLPLVDAMIVSCEERKTICFLIESYPGDIKERPVKTVKQLSFSHLVNKLRRLGKEINHYNPMLSETWEGEKFTFRRDMPIISADTHIDTENSAVYLAFSNTYNKLQKSEIVISAAPGARAP